MLIVHEPVRTSRRIEKAADRPAPQDQFSLTPDVAVLGIKMKFDAGEEIHGEGEPAEMLYRVIKGAVRIFNVRYDGRRQIEGFHLAGDIFGLDACAVHHASAEATVDETVIVAIWRTALDDVATRDHDVARHVLQLMNAEWTRSRHHALLLGRKNALERIAGFLLDMEERQGGTGFVSLPMGRIDIADYLGLTIETVSRCMTHLERDDVIAMPTTRHLRIINRGYLTSLVV